MSRRRTNNVGKNKGRLRPDMSRQERARVKQEEKKKNEASS